MNNRMTGTWFRRSVRNTHNSHILDLLDWATTSDVDVIELCRNDAELELSDMPDILKCKKDEEMLYDLHYRAYAMGDGDKKAVRKPFSPLTGEHVLNFCRHIEVHPADMVSTAASPLDSIPPHLYQALLLLKDKGVYQGDRERALEALRLERTRYQSFINSNPIAADYYALVAEFDAGRGDASDFKKAAVETLKRNQDQALRPLLLGVFQDKSWGRKAINPYDHFDDYLVHHQAVGAANGKAITERTDRHTEDVVELRGHLAMVYGMDKADFLYEALIFEADSKRKESKAKVIEAMFALARKHGANEAVRDICERAYGVHIERNEIVLRGQMLQNERGSLGAFSEWLKAAHEPEGFHMLYLYANQAISGRFEIPAAARQLPSYGRPGG